MNRNPIYRAVAAMSVVALLSAACAAATGVAPPATPVTTATADPGAGDPTPSDGVTSTTPPGPTTTIAATTTTTLEAARRCIPADFGRGPITIESPVAAAIAIAATTFPCADELTLTGIGDAAAPAAAAHAIGSGGPLLLVGSSGFFDNRLMAAITRLAPRLITVIGLEDLDLGPLADFDTRRLEDLPEPPGGEADVTAASPGRLWVVEKENRSIAWAVRAAAIAAGDSVVTVPAGDLRAVSAEVATVIRDAPDTPEVIVGLTEDAAWQLDVVRAGIEIPGGGQVFFPARRLIALYGHPGVPVLGVLGEQGPEAGIERLQPLLEAYAADGVQTIPTFEIIATIADAAAGADGDYSAEITVDALRPWIDVATARGAYVILDLQPGRTDFLTQAKRYEALLRLPNVGLALDPEWRLEPDQFHLRQIGSVDAAEINTVVEWLAGIVREESLPQKLLVLHQFRVDMIQDREAVDQPPELAIIVHADGQGALQLKYDTWGVLTTQPGSETLWWGWKNFYDEDPQLATPEQVLALEPDVFMVSFQ